MASISNVLTVEVSGMSAGVSDEGEARLRIRRGKTEDKVKKATRRVK